MDAALRPDTALCSLMWANNETGVLQPVAEVARLCRADRKSTRLNSSHTEIYTLSLHDALPIYGRRAPARHRALFADVGEQRDRRPAAGGRGGAALPGGSEEHTSELQSHRDLHSFPTRRSSDLWTPRSGPTPRSVR